MIFASSATVTGDVEKFLYNFSSYILQNFLRRSRYLLRSYSGECLGSSSDEERSELRYAIWIAEFRELLDLWTHAADWGNPIRSFTGVFNSFFRHGVFLRGSACSACVSSRLGMSNGSGASWSPCESDLVVEALVDPQLFVLAYSRGVLTARSFGWRVGCYVQIVLYITRFNWSYPLNLSI